MNKKRFTIIIFVVIFAFMMTNLAFADEANLDQQADIEQMQEVVEETGEEEEVEDVVEEEIISSIILTAGESFMLEFTSDYMTISVEGLSQDANLQLESMDFADLTIQEALEALISQMQEDALFISIMSQSQQILDDLSAELIALYSEDVIDTVLEIVFEEEDTIEDDTDTEDEDEEDEEGEKLDESIQERLQMAEELGITPGKMNLLEKLSASFEEEIDLEFWSLESVQAIMKQIKENRKSQLSDLEDEEEYEDDTDSEEVGDNEEVEEVEESKVATSDSSKQKGYEKNADKGKGKGKGRK